jgi:CubicO group peptidase (beta-lactamase class C family)
MNSIRFSSALVLSLTLLLCAVSGLAQKLPTTKPERVGFDEARLKRISAHMNQAVDDGVMVGGLGMIARKGRIAYSETWGMKDREAAVPMTTDTIFRIYSMSKPITGVALMMLYEEGRFFLNDPVAKYIPELANLQVAVSTAGASDSGDQGQIGLSRKPSRQPTIRDLLTHTAGFTYGVFGETEVDKRYREAQILFDHPSLQDFVQKLGKIPLQYDPGTRWHYSVSVDVQGRLVEVLSGMKFSEFLEKRVFEPLEMVDTTFVVPPGKLPRLAQLYSPKGLSQSADAFRQQSSSSELVVAAASFSEGYVQGTTFESGGGGLVSTADDYLRFSQMMLNGGELHGKRILSPKTVALMTTNHLGEIPMGFGRSGVGFGLGFAVALDQGAIGETGSAGEYNWGGAAGTRFWIDPQEELIGIFMVQSIPHRTRLSGEFKVLTYQALVD